MAHTDVIALQEQGSLLPHGDLPVSPFWRKQSEKEPILRRCLFLTRVNFPKAFDCYRSLECVSPAYGYFCCLKFPLLAFARWSPVDFRDPALQSSAKAPSRREECLTLLWRLSPRLDSGSGHSRFYFQITVWIFMRLRKCVLESIPRCFLRAQPEQGRGECMKMAH